MIDSTNTERMISVNHGSDMPYSKPVARLFISAITNFISLCDSDEEGSIKIQNFVILDTLKKATVIPSFAESYIAESYMPVVCPGVDWSGYFGVDVSGNDITLSYYTSFGVITDKAPAEVVLFSEAFRTALRKALCVYILQKFGTGQSLSGYPSRIHKLIHDLRDEGLTDLLGFYVQNFRSLDE